MNLFGARIGRTPASSATAAATATIPELKSKARFLLGYGMLSIAAGAIIPIVYIFIRLLVQEHNGDRIFGLWQASLRISEAYNQLPLMLLSVVLFARFASSAAEPLNLEQVRENLSVHRGHDGRHRRLRHLTRPYWIELVFTSDFAPMEAFVPWQLAGDSLKILSYVGTTILAARGARRLVHLRGSSAGGPAGRKQSIAGAAVSSAWHVLRLCAELCHLLRSHRYHLAENKKVTP